MTDTDPIACSLDRGGWRRASRQCGTWVAPP